MAMITLECSDGVIIDVDKELSFTMSGTIRKQLDSKQAQENPNTIIVVDNITSLALMKVLDFCTIYMSPNSVPNLKQWNEKFVRLEPAELCELASAAYYLEIRPLVDLTCKAIAKLLKGKSPAEIRKTFNILYDFAPGDDVPPPTLRDKLRTKLHFKDKNKDKENSEISQQDERSVDELVSFIQMSSTVADSNTTNETSSKTAKKRKGKKARAKQKLQLERSASSSTPESALPTLRSSTESASAPSPNEIRKSKSDSTMRTSFGDDGDIENFESEEEIDPEVKAAEDKEVEEFRKRLESIQTSESRPKIRIPDFEALASSFSLANK